MKRRTLRFRDFDDVLRDAESLLASGYDRAGTWSLDQVCHHLGAVIELSFDGFPSLMPWPVRVVARWFVLGRILRHRVFHQRVPAPSYMRPPESVEDSAGLERLKLALGRMKGQAGPMKPSPIFGALTPEQWREVHLWHCEHHFSFLLPRQGRAGAAACEPA